MKRIFLSFHQTYQFCLQPLNRFSFLFLATVDALKAAYPDLVATIQNEAAATERARIKGIEDLANGNYDAIAKDAKFDNPISAQEMAVKIISEQNKAGGNYIQNRQQDAEKGGANSVQGAEPEDKPLVPADSLALLSTNADYSMYYGAITLIKEPDGNFVTVEGKYVPDTWTKRKPARRFLNLSSAPLCVPHDVDSWFVATPI